jgi:hypothetical protein
MTLEERIKARQEAIEATPLPGPVHVGSAGELHALLRTFGSSNPMEFRITSMSGGSAFCCVEFDQARSFISEVGEMLDGVPWGPHQEPEKPKPLWEIKPEWSLWISTDEPHDWVLPALEEWYGACGRRAYVGSVDPGKMAGWLSYIPVDLKIIPNINTQCYVNGARLLENIDDEVDTTRLATVCQQLLDVTETDEYILDIEVARERGYHGNGWNEQQIYKNLAPLPPGAIVYPGVTAGSTQVAQNSRELARYLSNCPCVNGLVSLQFDNGAVLDEKQRDVRVYEQSLFGKENISICSYLGRPGGWGYPHIPTGVPGTVGLFPGPRRGYEFARTVRAMAGR